MSVDFGVVQAAWYLAVAGIAVAFYDHFLSFPDEVRYIWNARWSTPKFSFLISRYIIPTGLCYHIFLLGDLSHHTMSDKFCQRWFISASLHAIGLYPPLHFLVILWLWVLWGRNRSLVVATLFVFIVTELCFLCIGVYATVRLSPMMRLNSTLRQCTLTKRGLYPFYYVPSFCFDTVSLVTVLWNSLKTMRKKQTESVMDLYQDGGIFILLIFLMTTANLVVAATAPLSVIFLVAAFLFSTTTIAMTQLIIKMRKDSLRRRRPNDSRALSQLASSEE